MEKINHTYGQVRAFADNVEETRTVEFVISTATEDRHGSILNMENWQLDNFNNNGIVGYQHNVYGGDLCNAPDPDDVIGTGRAWVEDGKLLGSVTFEPAELNAKAEKIFRKVLAGTLKATSVGFKPLKNDKGKTGQYGRADENGNVVEENTYFYYGQELLEFSIVNIPSNPDALRRSMRDQASNAISYIYRQLGGKYRFADIEDMTVRNVIDLLQGKPAVPVSNRDESETDLDDVTAAYEADVAERDNDLILITRSKLALTAAQ